MKYINICYQEFIGFSGLICFCGFDAAVSSTDALNVIHEVMCLIDCEAERFFVEQLNQIDSGVDIPLQRVFRIPK